MAQVLNAFDAVSIANRDADKTDNEAACDYNTDSKYYFVVELLGRERKKLRVDLQCARELQLAAARAVEDADGQLERERQKVLYEMLRVKHERDDSMLACELEMGQLADCLKQLLDELAQAACYPERTRREAAMQQDAGRLALEDSAEGVFTQVSELERQREPALRDSCELKTQLKIVQEARDALRRELLEMWHRACELEVMIKAARKERSSCIACMRSSCTRKRWWGALATSYARGSRAPRTRRRSLLAAKYAFGFVMYEVGGLGISGHALA